MRQNPVRQGGGKKGPHVMTKKPGVEVLRTCSFVFVIIACVSIPDFAQSPPAQPETFLKQLEGHWQGEGKTLGMPARLRLSCEWVWKNKFLRLTIKNEMTSPNGQAQVFEGLAYYKAVSDGKYEATWFDSRGMSFPIKAVTEGNALIAFWGSPDKEQGKSIYRMLEPGKLEVIDEVRQKDGAWKEFGRFVARKE